MKIVGLHLMTSAANLSMTAIFTGAGLLFSRELARKMTPGSRRSWPPALTFALPAIAAFGGLAVLFPWRQSDAFVSEGWHCALLEAITAGPVAALFWLLARRGRTLLFPSAWGRIGRSDGLSRPGASPSPMHVSTGATPARLARGNSSVANRSGRSDREAPMRSPERVTPIKIKLITTLSGSDSI
jgi:hypothetical protein